MANSTVHGTLIKYEKTGTTTNQITIYPKNTGQDVSITANPHASSATTVQALINALGALAFKDSVSTNNLTTANFASGVITQELNITAEGKIADARALKTLNDKITTNSNNITKLNSKSYDVTLYFYNWNGSSSPYSYTIYNSAIEYDSVVDLIINSTTEGVVNCLRNAEISGYSQNTGSITIYAWGTKPATNISASLIVRGGI